MDNRVACVIIASATRRGLVFDRVLPSVLKQGFDEVVLVHDWLQHPLWADGGGAWLDVRVSPIARNTRDALLKRDAGTLATTSPTLVYLCDDHALAPNFLAELREVLDEPWDVLVPNRYTQSSALGKDDMGNLGSADSVRFHHPAGRVLLNMGEREGYCAGHAGVFRRYLVEACPWMSFAYGAWEYVRCWDVNSSAEHQRRGARYVFKPRSGIAVEDLEPERQPWK